jgi:5-methyltetrahydrofolate--homocysteine methyltransferase
VIRGIHDQYLDAGADIIETNTCNSNAVSQADYGLEGLVYELNLEAARLARAAADACTAGTPSRPRFVAGAIGPTSRTLSISPDVNNPAFRAVPFDELKRAYADQIRGLIDGGVDMPLLETIFDTPNAKAAFKIEEVQASGPTRLPLMISVTITDRSGRTLSVQTLDAFISMEHTRPWSVGINARSAPATCGRIANWPARPCWVSSSERRPAERVRPACRRAARRDRGALARLRRAVLRTFSAAVAEMPAHIAALAGAAAGVGPRRRQELVAARSRVSSAAARAAVGPPAFNEEGAVAGDHLTRLPVSSPRDSPDSNFQMTGERTNVTGSKRFARLIKEEIPDAAAVALEQVRGGAN